MMRQPIFILTGIMIFVCTGLRLSAQSEDSSVDVQEPASSLTEATYQVLSKPIPPRRFEPMGIVRLKRLRRTRFQFSDYKPKDTICVSISNAAGLWFKAACLYPKGGGPCPKGFAGNSFDTCFVVGQNEGVPLPAAYTLEVKAPLLLRRMRADVLMECRPYVEPDTVKIQYLLTIQRNAFDTTLLDTIRTRIETRNGQETRIVEDSQVTDEAGRQIRKQEQDSVIATRFSRRILADSDTIQIRQTRKTCVFYENFAAGDTVFIKVAGIEKPFQRLWLTDDNGTLLNTALQQSEFKDTLVIADQKRIQICLRGITGMGRKYASIDVQVQQPEQLDTLVFATDSVFQYTTENTYDTLLLTIADVQSSVAPRLNIEGETLQAIDIQVPLRTDDQGRLMYASYWFGLDYPSISAYAELEAEVPLEWAQLGVPLATAAYGAGYPINLPPLRHQDLRFFLATTTEKLRLEQGESFRSFYSFGDSRENYGRLSRSTILGGDRETHPIEGYLQERFFLCFQNTNAINTYPLDIKIVGYYRKLLSSSRSLNFVSTRTYSK